MNSEDLIGDINKKYSEISKNSLIRVQYSCSGNSCSFEEPDFVSYRKAHLDDFPEIINLLRECNLPYSDIVPEKQNFVVAVIDQKIIGCAGFEAYDDNGLFRSLAIKPLNRGLGISKKALEIVMVSAQEQGIKQLYLLTTTAEKLFKSIGWETISRKDVPEKINQTSQFSAICPSTAICMKLSL